VITPRIERYVRERFTAPDADRALGILRHWRISYEDEPPTERLTAAAVLAADGTRTGLDGALRLAEADWRDLLVAAGLAHAGWEAVLDDLMGPPDT
jgi:hypothetical protein